jgi:glycosyltransferase involved in cell wall biosynthesis
MRILEVVAGVGVNGAVLHARLIASELKRRGHEITLVCLPNSWVGKQLAEEDVTIIHSDMRRRPNDDLRRIANLCRDQQIDVIHTHMTKAHNFGVMLRMRSGIPCVAAAQNRSMQLHWMWNDKVIAVSEATRRYHRWFNLVRNSKIDVVHNFIDDRQFEDLDSRARRPLRARWGVPGDVPAMAVVGDVIPRKGAIHLIRALPAILHQAGDVRVFMVGPNYGTYHKRVRAEAERLGVADQVIWLGHRKDVPRVLTAADVFVLPTLEDNLPLAILEAMALGLPVVSTRVGGIPECVISGVTGEVVRPRNAKALAAALVPLLQDAELRQKYGAAGRKLMQERFSVESQVPQIETILAAAVHQRRAA